MLLLLRCVVRLMRLTHFKEREQEVMRQWGGGGRHMHPLQREKLIHEKRIQSLNFFFCSLFHTIKCTKRQTEREADEWGRGQGIWLHCRLTVAITPCCCCCCWLLNTYCRVVFEQRCTRIEFEGELVAVSHWANLVFSLHRAKLLFVVIIIVMVVVVTALHATGP